MFCLLSSNTQKELLFVFFFFLILELRFYGCCYPCCFNFFFYMFAFYFIVLLCLISFIFKHTVMYKNVIIILFPVWLLISNGLDPVLSHNEKSCIAPYYKQFSMNYKVKIIELILKTQANKTCLNSCNFSF